MVLVFLSVLTVLNPHFLPYGLNSKCLSMRKLLTMAMAPQMGNCSLLWLKEEKAMCCGADYNPGTVLAFEVPGFSSPHS